ncbi:MAG: hypothetical protein R3E67_09360 [Pseudomonadales bacterium]
MGNTLIHLDENEFTIAAVFGVFCFSTAWPVVPGTGEAVEDEGPYRWQSSAGVGSTVSALGELYPRLFA